MSRVVLLTGSNAPQSEQVLRRTADILARRVGEVEQASQIYTSEPWGFYAEELFSNQALILQTALTPIEVLDEALATEQELGRDRAKEQAEKSLTGERYASRVVDVDVMFYDEEIIDFSFGANSVGDAKHERKNVDYTNYEEDIYVGYRYFDTFGVDVSYPFGYGLSYTTFAYDEASVKAVKGGYEVAVKVTNTGKVAGKEVVQVYAAAPANAAGQPAQELVAFAKTKSLAPGESEVLTMSFTNKDIAWFDEARNAWVVDGGDYAIAVAASSRDAKANLSLNVAKEKVIEEVVGDVAPLQKLDLLKQ